MQNLKYKIICLFRDTSKNPQRLSILLIVGFALMLRVHHLAYESMWMDEIRQTSYYPHSLTQIVKDAATQNQPPLDYWIGHMVHFFSASDYAFRLPAALFGAGSVALLMMILSAVSSWPIAAAFGLVFAAMPFSIYYSQEARPYSIAVFFFLCMYWMLIQLLDKPVKKSVLPFLVFLLFTVAFLHSRTLSPLVVVFCLLLLFIVRLALPLAKVDHSNSIEKRKLMLTGCTIVIALVLYLPSLKIVLDQSARYVSDTSLGLDLSALASVAVNFNLVPIWKAFAVQSEPVTYPLVILVCLSPILGWRLKLHRKNPTWLLTTVLLPTAAIFNLFIFESKSGLPFRPAYASYILPLACILGGISLQGLWNLTSAKKLVHPVRVGILVLAAIISFQLISTVIDYKSMRRKSDWRGLAAFIGKNYGARDVLIFDSFSEYGAWEPTYYGFPRYYHGRSPMLSIKQIPNNAAKITELPYNPVFVLFQWKEYYLTEKSPYPILSVPTQNMLSINYQTICRDTELSCQDFQGFSIITLKHNSNNLSQDTYAIIERVLEHVPQGTWKVDLHLAAAALANALQMDQWNYHLRQAEKSVQARHLPRIKKIAGLIGKTVNDSP